MKNKFILSFTCVSVLAVFLSSCGKSTAEKKQDTSFSFANLGDDSTNSSASLAALPANLAGSINDTTHNGLDISRYQGNLLKDLNSSKPLRFIFCKATEGITYIDPDFRSNWHNIREKGFLRGAYHFYICGDDPVVQAQHFSGLITDLDSADLPPVLDIEQKSTTSQTNFDKMQSDLLVFLKEIKKLTGRTPMIYTGYDFANEHLKLPAFANYSLWLAEYDKLPQPQIPGLWKNKGYKIWQKSDSYDVNSENTDFDVYFGNLQNLVK